MASSSTRFRFLELPLEIQRNIFERMYEDRYVFKAQKGVLSRVWWTGGPPLAPLRTCRHFYREALKLYQDACCNVDIIGVDRGRLDLSFGQADKSWIFSVVKELTMFGSPSALDLRFTAIQTLKLVVYEGSYISDPKKEDQAVVEGALRQPGLLQQAENNVKDHVRRFSLSPAKDLIKQVTFVQHVVRTPGFEVNRISKWLVCVSFDINVNGDDIQCSHTRTWKEKFPLPPHDRLRRRFYAVVAEIANLRGPPRVAEPVSLNEWFQRWARSSQRQRPIHKMRL